MIFWIYPKTVNYGIKVYHIGLFVFIFQPNFNFSF